VYLYVKIDGRQVDGIKLLQGVTEVHADANAVINFLIKGKPRKLQSTFNSYYVSDVLHVSALQGHRLVVLFTKLSRKSHVIQCM